MPKYKVTTDQGTFAVELDQEPESQEQLNNLVTAHLSGQAPTETATPANAAEELKAKHAKNVAAGKAAESNWLGPIGTGGAAVVRTAGGMIPGGPLVSEPLAQLYENVAGTRQGFSKGLVAGETALSLIPGGKIAKGALKLAPRIGATAAKVGERAIMGEAAAGLPAAIEGQPYTPGLGAAAGVGLGAVAERVGKVRSQGIAGTIGTKVEQAALPRTNRSKKLAYGALSERIGPGTAKAQRLEKEIDRGLEPVFDFAANAKRKINNVEDLGSAAKDMAKVTDFEFNQAVDRVGDRLVNGRAVAQEIRDEITDLVRTTNPAQAENLERIAASFDRDMPIREVNQLRQEANNVLDSFYAKSPLQREHPAIGIAAQSSMADGLRKVLYDNLDEIYVDSPSIRQMMRERGAAEGINKFASESSGAARRQGMAKTNVRGPVTTPLTWGAKAAKTVVSPYETSKKVAKFAQRPDRKISEAYKLYIPRKARAPIGQPTPLPPKQLPYRTGPDTSGPIPPGPDMPPLPAQGSQFEQQPGGGYRFRDPTQQGLEYGREQNALAPQGYPPLPPEIENMTHSQWLRMNDVSEPQILMDEMIERTTQYPLARSRPGERGSIRFGGPENPEANAFSPKPPEEEWFSGFSPRFQQRRIEAQQRSASPEYHAQLSDIGLTPDEIRIHTTPTSQLNEVEQAVKKEVRHRVIQSGLADVDRSVSNLVEGTTNEAVKFNSALRQLRENAFSPSQKKRPMIKYPGGSGFNEQRYKFEQDVKVTFEDGSVHYDTVKGLNKGHALARARENWEGLKIEPVD